MPRTNTPAPSSERAVPTILVIDDHPPIRLMLQNVLEDEGYLVLMADDGQAGFDHAVAARPELILTDLMMPVMDGRTLGRKLRAEPRTAQIPMILMTVAYRRDDGDVFDAVLAKPFDLLGLLDLIQRLLGGTR